MQFPRCEPDHVAVWPDVRWSTLLGWADALAPRIPRGVRIAFQLQNSPQFLALLLATWRRGSTPALLHPRFPNAWVDALKPVVAWEQLVTDECFAEWCADLTPTMQGAPFEVAASDFASILFTSGSRGLPKPMLHTFDAHIASAAGANHRMPFRSGDRWLVSLPLCHVGGLSLLFRAALDGGALLFSRVETEPTHVSWVPTQLRRALDAGDTEWLRQLDLLLVGGGPVTPALFERAKALGIPVRQTYGMTETASQVATGTPMEHNCGAVLPGRSVRIINGQIYVGGETLTAGYITQHGVEPAVNEQGEIATGDLGRFDADGNLVVIGRVDNMFISGGENIQPETIEQVCVDFGFLEAVAVPVSDAEFGTRPFLFLDRPATERERGAVESKLARFMRPVGYGVLPQKSGLKRSRQELAELASQLATEPTTTTG